MSWDCEPEDGLSLRYAIQRPRAVVVQTLRTKRFLQFHRTQRSATTPPRDHEPFVLDCRVPPEEHEPNDL